MEEKKVKISVNFDMDFFVEFEKEDMEGNGINWENWIKELKNNDNESYKLFFDNIDFEDFLDRVDDSSWKIKVEES